METEEGSESHMQSLGDANIHMAGSSEDLAAVPMFKLERVQPEFDLANVDCSICSDVLVLPQLNGTIIVSSLANPSVVQTIYLTKKSRDVKISDTHLDPTGQHLLVVTQQRDVFYVALDTTTSQNEISYRVKPVMRSKGLSVTCVAWNSRSTRTSTREILLGLADGSVYETVLDGSTEMFKWEDKSMTKVYHCPKRLPIVGLYQGYKDQTRDKNWVLVGTRTGLRLFTQSTTTDSANVGLGTLLSLDSGSLDELEAPAAGNGSDTPTTEPVLSVYIDKERDKSTYAWLCNGTVLHGSLDEAINGKADLASTASSFVPPNLSSPIFVTLSQYHVLIVSGNEVTAVNEFANSVVFSHQIFSEASERALRLTSDNERQTYWICSRDSLFEIVVTDEARQMPLFYLDKDEFALALEAAKSGPQKDIVAIAYAERLIQEGDFALAAEYFAKSSKPVHDVGLEFMDIGQSQALLKYLLLKLNHMQKSWFVQRVILSTWALEIIMAEMCKLEEEKIAKSNMDASDAEEIDDSMKQLSEKYSTFIKAHKHDIHKETAYQLISSHGRDAELIEMAKVYEDFDYIFSFHVGNLSWSEALETILQGVSAETIYRHASSLLLNRPTETIDTWMRLYNILDVSRLLPSLLTYHYAVPDRPFNTDQAIRFLRFAIFQKACKQSNVHDCYFNLIASYGKAQEDQVLTFLQFSQPDPHYDLNVALSTCIQNGLSRASVQLFCMTKKFDSAIEYALKHGDIDQAVTVVLQCDEDSNLRHRLWVRVAREMLKDPSQVDRCLKILKTKDSLKIEDLLPILPDDMAISQFKDEICETLEDYSMQIDSLHREMELFSMSTRAMESGLEELKNKFAVIQPGERCRICAMPLLPDPMYVFPCQHAFHAACLLERKAQTANAWTRRKIKELQADIARNMSTRRRSEQQLEAIVAEECVLCGDIMVNSITAGFLDDVAEAEISAWSIDT